MKELFQNVMENLVFVLEFAAVILAMFFLALLLEKAARKKRGIKEPIFTVRIMAMTGTFYKLDFSELPILIGAFAFGPAAGVMMEFLKILLKLFIKGTSTAFVGDLANFVVGCSFILPASAIYAFRKNRKSAVAACVVGTLILTVFGTAFNAVYLLPAFAKLYGMPLEDIMAMGAAINPLVKDGSIVSFVVACVAPLNLIKGGLVSVVTLLVYKSISPIIKSEHRK